MPDGLDIVGLALDRASAYAGLRAASSSVPTLYRTPSNGTGVWEPVIDPVTGAPLVYLNGHMPTIDNGVILAAIDGSPCSTRLITGPDTDRTLESCGIWQLTQGGDYLTKGSNTLPYPWSLHDLDGVELDSADANHGSIDGPTVADGIVAEIVGGDRVTTRAIGSPTLLTSQPLPASCRAWPLIGMRNGNIVARCPASGLSVVVRTDGSLPPHPLPGWYWQVGNGFAVSKASGAWGTQSQIEVVDLGSAHDAVQVPALAGPGPAPDRGDARRFLLRSGEATIQVATVDGLGPLRSAAEDLVAPSLELDGPGPAYAADGGGPHFSWAGADPTHPSAVDYQWGWKSWSPATPEPAWPTVPVNGGTADHADLGVTEGSRNVCLRARAIDWAHNVGEWVERCTYVDDADPLVAWRLPEDRYDGLHRAPASVPVRARWAGSDDDQVTFDVRYRVAPAGREGGAVLSPTAWTGITATSVSKTFAEGTTTCFWVRAEDRSGHTATPPFGQSFCATVPMDDRSFALRGAARRVTVRGAYSATATVLRTPRDAVVRSGMLADIVHVRILGGRLAACPRVKVGIELGQNCAVRTDGDATVYRYRFPSRTRGALQVRLAAPSAMAVRVDAVYAVHH